MVSLAETAEIPSAELVSILHQGALLRLPFLEGKFNQAAARVRDFEEKHHITLSKLKQQGLPANAGYELHEDFIEWEYWADAVSTHPHHRHVAGQEATAPSTATCLEDVMVEIENSLT